MDKNEAILWVVGIITAGIVFMSAMFMALGASLEQDKQKHIIEYKKLELMERNRKEDV
jgi:hypothetical protein